MQNQSSRNPCDPTKNRPLSCQLCRPTRTSPVGSRPRARLHALLRLRTAFSPGSRPLQLFAFICSELQPVADKKSGTVEFILLGPSSFEREELSHGCRLKSTIQQTEVYAYDVCAPSFIVALGFMDYNTSSKAADPDLRRVLEPRLKGKAREARS